MAKTKKKRDKKMSDKSLSLALDLRKTKITQNFLIRFKDYVNKSEKEDTIDVITELWDSLWKIKLDKCQELKDCNTEEERIVCISNIVTDLLNGEEFKDKLEEINNNRAASLMSRLVYTALNVSLVSDANRTVNRSLGMVVAKTTRKIGFSLLYKNFTIDISYILSIYLNDEDIDDLVENKWVKEFDGVLATDCFSHRFHVKPISKFQVVVNENLDGEENSKIKQGIVLKHIPINTRTLLIRRDFNAEQLIEMIQQYRLKSGE